MHSYLIRTLDITLAISGILLCLPIILSIILLGYCFGKSPLFYQQRVGKDQRLFTLVKFRTMPAGTQSVGTHLVDANSITTTGRLLRKTKFDELPQLINVLFGQMSMVGPRPCLPNQEELVHEREARGVFAIRPGITGLAQINDVDMSTPRKLARYDKILIEKLNLEFYLRIIIATVSGKGSGDRIRD
jgi:O-antigen biosynthesis protein WbqP